MNELARKSADRVAASPSFLLVKQFNDYRNSRKQKSVRAIPLNLAYFKTRATERDQWLQSLDELGNPDNPVFTVENNHYSQELMRVDAYGKELNDFLINNIREDFYLAEAYQIIRDLILYTNPK